MSRTSFHAMYTPETRPRGSKLSYSYQGPHPQRVSMSSGSEVPFSPNDIVESIGYFFENSANLEVSGLSRTSARVARESAYTWKLLLEMSRMDAFAERIAEQMFVDDVNPIRDAFLNFPSFRKLIALRRWIHYINRDSKVNTETSTGPILNTTAYPETSSDGSEIPLDLVLREKDRVNRKDVDREAELCKNILILLSQGKLTEAINLSCESGHAWRAGVLNAAAGHLLLNEGEDQDVVDVDWIESAIIAGFLGFDSGLTKESLDSRYLVKETATTILHSQKCTLGVSEFDIAITAFICGNESQMRKVGGNSFSMNLWISLHCLQEEFVAFLLNRPSLVSDEMRSLKMPEIDTYMQDRINLIMSSLETGLSLDSENQFSQLHVDIALGNIGSAVTTMVDWVEHGILRMGGSEIDIDIYSSGADFTAGVLVRSMSASLVAVLRDITAREHKFDRDQVSSIIIGNIESVVLQLRQSESLLESNQIVAENLNLLNDDIEARKKMWVWYLKHFQDESWPEWNKDNILAFPPLLSLIETFPAGAIPVMKDLLAETTTSRMDTILSHSVGTSISAGKDVAFVIGCMNAMWLTTQSAAKSTGNGIYLDICADPTIEDPDDAATNIVSALGNLMGEGLMALLLADLHATKQMIDLTRTVPATGHKLMSIHAALDSIHEADSAPATFDTLGVACSFVKMLERVTVVMERNSLLEQQKANLPKLTARMRPVSGQSVASATDARRQIMEAQRLIDSSTEMIVKIVDDIILSLQELLKSSECPVNMNVAFSQIDSFLHRKVVVAVLDVVVESCIQALALIDDRKRQEYVVRSVKESPWLNRVLSSKRIEAILEEIL